jgi:hypothetical protein
MLICSVTGGQIFDHHHLPDRDRALPKIQKMAQLQGQRDSQLPRDCILGGSLLPDDPGKHPALFWHKLRAQLGGGSCVDPVEVCTPSPEQLKMFRRLTQF